jgi:hypothetical protein
MSKALYERRDQTFSVTVYDTDGVTIIPASTYLNAQYRIFPTDSCTPIVSKSLGAGIAVSGQLFAVTLDETDITVNGINGEYRHVFVVGTTVDEVLPNIVDELVDIIPGCAI